MIKEGIGYLTSLLDAQYTNMQKPQNPKTIYLDNSRVNKKKQKVNLTRYISFGGKCDRNYKIKIRVN